MKNLTTLLAKLLLAVCFSASAGVAAAGPLYRVDINTSTLGAGPAYLGLYFLSLDDASAALATVTNLAGAFADAPAMTGSVTGAAPGPLVFSNANGGGELVQAITLGGHVGFDVRFLMDIGTIGTTFGWALFGETAYLGADGDLGNIFLNPAAAPGEQERVALASQLTAVTLIPEPSSVLLLLLAGSALLLVRRRRH